jgi:hypothetical protein
MDKPSLDFDVEIARTEGTIAGLNFAERLN